MKKLLFLNFLMVAALIISSWMCVATNQMSTTKFKVTGSIMQTLSYCGGAQPTRQILVNLKTPRGIPFGKLYVVSGLMNDAERTIIDTIQADKSGNFSVDLPEGNYCLLEEWKTKPFELPLNNSNETVDSACYRNLYNTCDFTLDITDKNIDQVKIIFHRTCFFNKPCISYHGPRPHKARPR